MRRLVALGGGLLVLLVVLLIVAQLALPSIAAQRVRDRLAATGRVVSVSVHAFPAIELLWHHADSIDVHMASYRSGTPHLAGLLDQAADVGTLSARADRFQTGLLTLRDAHLDKRGQILEGSAQVTEADLRAALPVLQSVTPVASGGGQLVLRGTATLFGVSASADATVSSQAGALVSTISGPLGSLPIRLFSDPHVAVGGVSADRTASGFRVRVTGVLH